MAGGWSRCVKEFQAVQIRLSGISKLYTEECQEFVLEQTPDMRERGKCESGFVKAVELLDEEI